MSAVLAAAETEVKAEAAAAAAAIKRRVGQMTAALERKAADIHARAEACLGFVSVHVSTAMCEEDSCAVLGDLIYLALSQQASGYTIQRVWGVALGE